MDTHPQLASLLVLLLSLAPLCHGQTSVYLTEPTLTSVVAVNSTALTVNWQFADAVIDQSDLIRVYIIIAEYFTGYNTALYTANYTFTTNKTITSWTQNFPLVNAFYSVCFSSNSTKTNVTQFVAVSQCRLARTCLRTNSSVCPSALPAVVLASSVASTSFLIVVHWFNTSSFVYNTTSVQLAGANTPGTLISSVSNGTYFIQTFRFTDRQPRTTYTVNAMLTYAVANQLRTDTSNLTVTTSRSSKPFLTSDLLIFGAALLSLLLLKSH